MIFNIVVTSSFKKQSKRLAKKYHSLKNDLAILIDLLEKDPKQGSPLGKDCYKIRISITSKSKGKRGSSLVITCVKIINKKVYLLSIFDKSDKENIANKELDNLLRIAGLL